MIKEAFVNLTVREKQVLASLISHYITSADPVGSRIIANKFMKDLSAATIRNTLQDLEEMGLVTQPHTSAGRIPTDQGYRLYVDYLLQPNQLEQDVKDKIRQNILKEGKGINEILGQTCRILSEITTQLGVTIAPRFDAGILKRLELIPLSHDRLMAVVVVESGLARSVIIEIETEVSDRLLKDVENVLNERLDGLSLGDIRDSISKRMSDISGKGRLINVLIDSKEKIWSNQATGEAIHVAGADRLVQQPEFASQEKLSELLKVLEDGKMLTEFLRNQEFEGLLITIGKENRFVEAMNCSLVTSTYKVGNIRGTVGIIGPTRMPYSQLVSVVEYAARTITEVLGGYDEKAQK
jgi:heat-inducible transcriptional repressor